MLCQDKRKTQEICDKVVDDFLRTLKFAPDWFFTTKLMWKKLSTAFYFDDGLFLSHEDSGNVTFWCNDMGILNNDLNNINLDNNFDEDDPDTITHIKLLARHIKLENRKALKKELN